LGGLELVLALLVKGLSIAQVPVPFLEAAVFLLELGAVLLLSLNGLAEGMVAIAGLLVGDGVEGEVC
jgi:hypothetical protein